MREHDLPDAAHCVAEENPEGLMAPITNFVDKAAQ
jgi:hypothetical protein